MLSALFPLVHSVYRAVGASKKLWHCEGEEGQFSLLQAGRESHETEDFCKKVGFILIY